MMAKSVRAWSAWRNVRWCTFVIRTSCQNMVDRWLTLAEARAAYARSSRPPLDHLRRLGRRTYRNRGRTVARQLAAPLRGPRSDPLTRPAP
jgi:hypothetical protein